MKVGSGPARACRAAPSGPAFARRLAPARKTPAKRPAASPKACSPTSAPLVSRIAAHFYVAHPGDAGTPFVLPPSPWPVELPEPDDVPNATPYRNGLDVRDWARNLKRHGPWQLAAHPKAQRPERQGRSGQCGRQYENPLPELLASGRTDDEENHFQQVYGAAQAAPQRPLLAEKLLAAQYAETQQSAANQAKRGRLGNRAAVEISLNRRIPCRRARIGSTQRRGREG